MKNQISYSPEVRERAVRLVFEQQKDHESQWSAIKSIASKIGCTAETLRTFRFIDVKSIKESEAYYRQ